MTLYYHGGVAGLRVGDELRPPCETDAPSIHDETAAAFPGQPNPHRNDRVYVTTSHEVAFMYAYALLSRGDNPPDRGAVYLVDPVGELERDPDQPGFQCERAIVRAVAVSAVFSTPEHHKRANAIYDRLVAGEFE